MLDWTHTNAVTLQKIGYEAALPMAKLLKDGGAPPPLRRSGLPPIAGGSNGHLEDHRYKARRGARPQHDHWPRQLRTGQSGAAVPHALPADDGHTSRCSWRRPDQCRDATAEGRGRGPMSASVHRARCRGERRCPDRPPGGGSVVRVSRARRAVHTCSRPPERAPCPGCCTSRPRNGDPEEALKRPRQHQHPRRALPSDPQQLQGVLQVRSVLPAVLAAGAPDPAASRCPRASVHGTRRKRLYNDWHRSRDGRHHADDPELPVQVRADRVQVVERPRGLERPPQLPGEFFLNAFSLQRRRSSSSSTRRRCRQRPSTRPWRCRGCTCRRSARAPSTRRGPLTIPAGSWRCTENAAADNGEASTRSSCSTPSAPTSGPTRRVSTRLSS